MRVTADTNIYISALLFDGLPGAFLDLALSGSFTLVISAAILDELEGKLVTKFNISQADVRAIRRKLETVADEVTPTKTIAAIKDDPDDNRVLEYAVEGAADVIVSGDKHLLALGTFQEIPIIKVRQFLDSIETDMRPDSLFRPSYGLASFRTLIKSVIRFIAGNSKPLGRSDQATCCADDGKVWPQYAPDSRGWTRIKPILRLWTILFHSTLGFCRPDAWR